MSAWRPEAPDRDAVLLGRFRRITAALVAVTTATVLGAWVVGWDRVTSLSPDWASMKPMTALSLFLLSLCGLVPRRTARVLAVAPATIAAVTLVEYAAGVEGNFDRLFIDVSGSGPYPARMAVSTAVCLLALSVAQLLSWRNRRVLVESLALFVGVVAALALVGYLYGASALYSVGPYTSIALLTAMSLLLLALMTLAGVPDGAATWLLFGVDAGATLVRWLLPVILVVLPVTGYLCVLGYRDDRYDARFGYAALSVTAMALVGSTSWYTARRLAGADDRRRHALAMLQLVNADLEQRVSDRARELEAERGRTAVLNDRQRIAADMHDHVIQGLYAVGLSLHAAAGTGASPEVTDAAVLGIDEAIRELRTSIFDLSHPPRAGEVVGRLEKLAAIADGLGAGSVSLTHRGPVDLLPDQVAENLLAAAREAMSNAVRHADASTVTVDLSVTEDEAVLTVADDGTGLDPATESTGGLRNMRVRAARLGGSCTWQPRHPHGTAAIWRVPVSAPPPSPALGEGPPLELTDDLLATMAVITEALAAGTAVEPAHVITDAARALLEADYAAVVALEPPDRIRLVAMSGLPEGSLTTGATLPREATVTGYVMDSGEPLKLDHLSDAPLAARFFGGLPLGPALILPVGDPGSTYAALAVARRAGEPRFTDGDLARARVVATILGSALRVGRPRDEMQQPRPARRTDSELVE